MRETHIESTKLEQLKRMVQLKSASAEQVELHKSQSDSQQEEHKIP